MKTEKIEGVGLSLRFPHFDEILKFDHKVPWFEVVVDDFLVDGPHWDKLRKLREQKPIAMHSIGMNIGGTDPWNKNYLNKLKSLYEEFQPEWVSDHLCWSAHNGRYHHDLLPIPRSKEGLKHVTERIDFLQNYFNRPLVLENITQYVDFKAVDYSEIDFINSIIKKTGCFLLLDITNMIINHKNRDLSYDLFLEQLPLEKIKQVHLAGGIYNKKFWVDSHNGEVNKEDVCVYKEIYKHHKVPAVIERDDNLPRFKIMENEVINISKEVNVL